MKVDQELYRNDVRVAKNPTVRMSVIDISPDHPQRTLVFLHGFAGQARQWTHQLQQFSKENRVIAPDLRGHGRSDKPPGRYTMAEIIADLETMLDSLGVAGRFVLVGHSFGGAVATEYALAHPERIERLVLIATAGEFRLNALYRFGLNLPGPVLRIIEPLTRNWLSAPPGVLKSWYHHNLSQWNGWSRFEELSVATLVIRGHLDAVFEKPLFEKVARMVPAAEEVDVGVSGHLVMLERRDAVNRALQRFLEEPKLVAPVGDPFPEATARAALLGERPWLSHYEEGVPYTVAVPDIPLHQLLRSAVRRFPRRSALIFEGNRISYLRLYKEVNRFANALSTLGVESGQRVLLLLPNIPQLVIAFYGALKSGAVVVFTLLTTGTEELQRQVQESEAQVLVSLNQMVPQIEPVLAKSPGPVRHVILTGATDYLPSLKRLVGGAKPPRRVLDGLSDIRWHQFDQLLYSHPGRSPDLDVSSRELAVIQYTGGTTAEPKGVMLSHRNLVTNTLQTRHWMPDAREGQERFLSVLPFAHIYGLTTALNLPISIGATLILKARFEVLDVLHAIKKYRPTIFPGVPSMYMAIKDTPGVRRYGINTIKACLSGSAPLPVEVQEAFEKLTRGRLVEGYGLTEAGPVTHANPLQGTRKIGTIGVPLPSTEARVVDLKKGLKEVPTGQIGELAVRGEQVMMGYWKSPVETSAVLSSDGWLHTGDVAQMDAEGFFRIIARKVDMWYPAMPGEPAFPRDVEEVLHEVPQVKEAAVVAIAGQPIAFVIAQQEKPSADSLIAYCRRRLPPELVPRLIIFLDDFPRTFIGKVLRRELAKRYHDQDEHSERA